MRSELATFDLRTRKVKPVLARNMLVEAPNWTPDGSELLVNADGKLFRIPLDRPEMIEIRSGFANRINNDHGISPDGNTILLSDSTQFGASAIYRMPFCGGTPEAIVRETPSYWHGLSPDGGTVAYVADRGGKHEIYTCPIMGGSEEKLTDGFDHCDGPDYTPDGEWIWFNGEIDRSVQLWRMRPNGEQREQMTDDERVNWFPHPSPDGRHVLYLAYEGGVRGHPSNRQVQLRLMPAVGGAPDVLVSLLGGQGTINVPCWSPSAQQFAFVRYCAEA